MLKGSDFCCPLFIMTRLFFLPANNEAFTVLKSEKEMLLFNLL